MKYYTIQNDGLLTADNKQTLTRFYDNVLPLPEDYEVGKYVIKNGELVRNPNFEEEQEQKEKERIQELFMTRSDFFDATIKAFGTDEDDLLTAIGSAIVPLGIDNTAQKIALNNYKNALNFYRKHPLFTMLSNVPIKITEELTVTITPEQWDKFFDEANKKNPEAYKELLPKEGGDNIG